MKPSKLLLTYLPAPEPRIITAHDLRYFEPCYCRPPVFKITGDIRIVNCIKCNDTGYIGVQSIVLID